MPRTQRTSPQTPPLPRGENLPYASNMAIGTPSYLNTRPKPGVEIPNSRPRTDVPRPKVFPANTNAPPLPPTVPGPFPTKGTFRTPRLGGVAGTAISVFRAAWLGSSPTPEVYRADPQSDGATLFTPDAAQRPTQTPGPPTKTRVNVLQNDYANPNLGRLRPQMTSSGWWVYTQASWVLTGPGQLGTMTLSAPYYIPANLPGGSPNFSTVTIVEPNPLTQPRFQPGIRPVPKPLPSTPRLPKVNPNTRLSRALEIYPNGTFAIVSVPSTKPPLGTKEAKAVGAAAGVMGIVMSVFNTVTEVADALKIFHDNMPGRQPGDTLYDTIERMMENPELWSQVDWTQLGADIVANEIEDQVVGRLHGLKSKLGTEWGVPVYGSAFEVP